jgi:small neutral amino acid transporter SnatA (MarC family)
LVAVRFADWFAANPQSERYFQWGALPVFAGLGFYLIFFAKPPRAPEMVDQVNVIKQFGQGVLVSAFNLLAIPYWFAYVALLRTQGHWQEGGQWVFALGVTLGTMAALLLYALLGQWLLRRSDAVARIANRVVGLMFLALALQVALSLLG